MAKWSVHIIQGEALEKLGTVEAMDKRDAVIRAIREFGVPFPLQGRVMALPARSFGLFEIVRTWYRSRYPRSAA
jgi:hypothetical protein